MKLVLDERVKHRLVGIAVIVSIAVVFAPALLKKSQKRLDDTISVSLTLPPKPQPPQVSMREPNELFKTVTAAHVTVPVPTKEVSRPLKITKAEPLSTKIVANKLPNPTVEMDKKREAVQQVQKDITVAKGVQTAQLQSAYPAVVDVVSQGNNVALSQLPSIKQKAVSSQQNQANLVKPHNIAKTASVGNAYGVQLATFAIQSNAIALVAKLKQKGYQASYIKVPGKGGDGVYYKVVVGHAQQREQAQRLQKQLAAAVQMNGFVVTKQG